MLATTKTFLKNINQWYDNKLTFDRFLWVLCIAVPGILMTGADSKLISITGLFYLLTVTTIRFLYIAKKL